METSEHFSFVSLSSQARQTFEKLEKNVLRRCHNSFGDLGRRESLFANVSVFWAAISASQALAVAPVSLGTNASLW